MKEVIRVCENIFLGMFVNSLYGLTNGNYSGINLSILLTSIVGMIGAILYNEKERSK